MSDLPRCTACAKTRNLNPAGACYACFVHGGQISGADDDELTVEAWGGTHDLAPADWPHTPGAKASDKEKGEAAMQTSLLKAAFEGSPVGRRRAVTEP